MASDFEKAADALLFTEELSFKTAGASMEPLFVQHRDVVNIRSVNGSLKRGDVVLYPSNSSEALVLHRVLKVKGENLIIRGDNNYFIEHRKVDEVVGVMASFFRKGKYCDVNNSFGYKIYTFYILNSFFPRKLWYRIIKPKLSIIRRKIYKKPTD